jgi:hypothetical protein
MKIVMKEVHGKMVPVKVYEKVGRKEAESNYTRFKLSPGLVKKSDLSLANAKSMNKFGAPAKKNKRRKLT